MPRRSTTAAMPAQPMATSVSPRRHGRPNVSETTTATSTPARARRPSRMCRAERSGSSGSSAASPAATFDTSTPALAHTNPCGVSLTTSSSRRRRTRADSRSISARRAWSSPSGRGTSRPSALETIFWVTTTTSPSRSSTASAIRSATTSPGPTSGRPSTGMTSMARIRRLRARRAPVRPPGPGRA